MSLRFHRGAAIVLAALFAVASAAAAEPPPIRLDFGAMARLPRLGSLEPEPLSLEPRSSTIGTRGRFLHDHLMPRIDQQLDKLGPLDEARIPGRWLADGIYAERLGERTGDVVEHAAGKALRDFLLEETTLNRVVTSLESAAERIESGAPQSVSRPGAGLKLDLGIAHGAPQLLLKRDLPRGSLRFSVGSRGDLGVRLRHGRPGLRAGMTARIDPSRDRYVLSCSLDF